MAVAHSPIPWLHIADEVAAEAKKQGYRQLGILGTVYTMTGPVYPFSLEKQRIRHETPNEPDRFRIDQIIMDELVHGVFTEPSRQYYNKVIQKFKTQGCDAAVLGCTEIPLLVDPNDCPLSTLDSTRILAQAAIRRSLSN
jgi:aspartate racemase